MNHKIGVHWIKVHGRPADLEYIRQLQPPSIKLVAGDVPDVQWISDCHQAAPNAKLVLRSHAMSEQKGDMASNPVFTGKRHAQEWRNHIEKLRTEAKRRQIPFPNDDRLIVLGINEPEVWNHLKASVDYNVAFLDGCKANGLVAGALNLSVGWPANTGPDTPPDWNPYASVEAAIVRGRHYLMLHEYHDVAGPSENWRWWCGRYLQCPWDVSIIMGEYGIDRYVKDAAVTPRGWRAWLSPEQYTAQIREYHEMVLKDKRIHSIQIYTSDWSAPWDSFDLLDAYPCLLAYAAEVGKRPVTATAWTGYVVARLGLNVRTEPDTQSAIIKTLRYGDAVTVHAKTGDWYWISHDGTPGYVFAEYVSRKLPVVTSGPDDPNFEKSIVFVFDVEKGLSLDPEDKGNWTSGIVRVGELKGTKFGISAAAYPNLDIKNLTIEQAKELYFKDYWQKSGADKLDWPMCLAVLDFAVNAGFGRAQQALSSTGDDFIKYMAWRIDWYTRIDGWGRYGAAWIRRCAALMNEVRK